MSQASHAEAKAALASAEPLDAKAVRAFDFRISLPALARSTGRGPALEKGAAGSSFLRSGVGSALCKLAMSSNWVLDDDRSTLLFFLPGSDNEKYALQNGAISCILTKLRDQMCEVEGSNVR